MAFSRNLLIPAFLTGFALALFLSLGFWQVERLQWKTDLLARIEANMETSMRLYNATQLADIDAAEYSRVHFSGELMSASPIFLHNTGPNGAAGYHVYAPVRSDDLIVIVNFGWVPRDAKGLDVLAAYRDRTLGLSGYIRLSREGNSFTPANDPAAEEWFRADVDAFAAHFNVTAVPFFLDRTADSDVNGGPVGGVTLVNIPNNHLSYAFTWFSLAIVVLVIFTLWLRRRRSDA